MHHALSRLARSRPPEDWAWIVLLAATGLFLLLSERFWAALPF